MNFLFKILLIEDNQLNTKIITFWLSKSGFIYKAASSGEEGVEIFRNNWYDVIIMDVMLPGINGFETTKLIRKASHENYGRQPFMIALTANTLDNDRERCMKEGLDEYISKPFDMKKLNDILEKVISGSTVI